MMAPPQMHYNGHFTEPYTSSQGWKCYFSGKLENEFIGKEVVFIYCNIFININFCSFGGVFFPRQPVHEQSEWLLLPLTDQPGPFSSRIQQWRPFT